MTNWDSARLLPGGHSPGPRAGEDDLHRQAHQVSRQLWQTLKTALGKAPLDGQIVTFDPAQLPQLVHERHPYLGFVFPNPQVKDSNAAFCHWRRL
jgi:hypothetical protein